MNNYCEYKNYLVNGQFTEPKLQNNEFKYYTGNQITGWDSNTAVIMNESTAWGYPIPYPCGNQACSIQNTSSIQQTFSVPKTGSYLLVYYICGRNCCDNDNVANKIKFELNGQELKTVVPDINKWNYDVLKINLTKTTGNIFAIKGLNTQGDKSAAIQVILTDDLINDSIDGYFYKGCFKDENTRAIKNKIGTGNINQCIALAKQKGYDTVGLQYGNQCWAGNQGKDGTDYDKYGVQTNVTNCNLSSPGAWTNLVYHAPPNTSQSKLPTAKLTVNQKLTVGKILYSDNREFYMILQQDGNLCIYDQNDQRVWQTNTPGKKSNFLILQTDGNLCIYPDNNSGAIWCTMTNGKRVTTASLDNDGAFRIYNSANQVVWYSTNPIVTPKPVPSEVIEADFDYDFKAFPVYVIGNYGIAPWGSTNFPDKTAQWIWYSPLANSNAPNNSNEEPTTIQYIWNNTTNIEIEGTLNIIIDNNADVILNKKQIANNIEGGWTGNWPKVNFIALPGSNLFEFKVKNAGGPAGLIVSAITTGQGQDNNNVLFHTDNTWKFIAIEPAHIDTCTLSQAGLVNSNDKYFPWGSLSLNSSPSQYINVGKTITGMNGLSFGCWFKSNNNSSFARVFDFGNGSSSDNIAMFVNNGTIGGSVYITNIQGNQLNFTPNINNNQWNHIVWTLSKPNGNTSNWIVYLNGKLTYNKPGNYPINLTRKNCYIGKSNWESDPYWNGSFANFVMYQKELSGLEVNALYNNMIRSSDPSLYLYLPFASNSVLDTIANNYAGKVFNLPIKKSTVESENWNCMPEGKNFINVKMNSENASCMSLDGTNCVISTESECKTLSMNPVTPEMPVNCSPNQTGWCVDAKNYLSNLSKPQIPVISEKSGISVSDVKPGSKALSALDSTTSSESINLKPLAGGGKILSIKNMIDVNSLMIGGIFKLRVNLPMMPPYIKGKNFNTQTGVNPNYFYLSIEKLDDNCSIKNPNGTCRNVYADNKNCSVKALTAHNMNNSYRLILVSSQYALDPSIPFGKNTDFTLVQVGGQVYLKNVQTGYFPSLYSSDANILVYGNMVIDSNSNVTTVQQSVTNNLCGQETPPVPKSGTQNIRCNIEQDPGMYLMTSNNVGESSPVRVNVNNDNSISLNLLSFNKYGYPTKVYALTFCNFNVKTYSYIEKITNTLGTFLVNMVCFEDVQNSNKTLSNQLKFAVELISFPPNFIKDNSIFTIG